jgi:hypothetical protein
MQMTVEEGRRLIGDRRHFTQRLTKNFLQRRTDSEYVESSIALSATREDRRLP